MTTPPLVLASGSAARRRLLESAGLRFTVKAAAVDEAAVKRAARIEGLSAAGTALLLADRKAAEIAGDLPESLVLGADQILVCGGIWYDKPGNLTAAEAQLRALRGQTHELATAVVCHHRGARVWHHLDYPRLAMRQFSDAYLADYLSTEGEAVLSSVGCYRLEGRGALLFERVEGDFFSVLGLPLFPLLGFLRQQGVLQA